MSHRAVTRAHDTVEARAKPFDGCADAGVSISIGEVPRGTTGRAGVETHGRRGGYGSERFLPKDAFCFFQRARLDASAAL